MLSAMLDPQTLLATWCTAMIFLQVTGYANFQSEPTRTPADQLVLAYMASCFTFTCLYGAHMLLLQAFWPDLFDLDRRLCMTNAERLNGVWHSSSTVLLSGYALWSSYSSTGWFQYDGKNSQAMEVSLLITLGFFTVDTATMWAACWLDGGKDRPVVFSWHHFACCWYASTCLWLGFGAETAAVAQVMGEMTNPMQNIWFISKDLNKMGIYAALSPIFTYWFVAVRVILTPIWSADVIRFCAFTPNKFGVAGPLFGSQKHHTFFSFWLTLENLWIIY